jgi:hypothetical protein
MRGVENGEEALRAALRRWRRGQVAVESQADEARAAGREREEESAWATDGRSEAEGARIAGREREAEAARAGEHASRAEGARAGERGRWWPRLTPSQVQALLGAGITLGLLLWEQIRERLPK